MSASLTADCTLLGGLLFLGFCHLALLTANVNGVTFAGVVSTDIDNNTDGYLRNKSFTLFTNSVSPWISYPLRSDDPLASGFHPMAPRVQTVPKYHPLHRFLQ